MPHIEILVGSPNDAHFVWESELTEKLDEAGITWEVSAASAHRNDGDLTEHLLISREYTNAYVCAAGWAAALPGAVKAKLLRYSLATVFGVALPSEEYPDAQDAIHGITRLPPGIDVEHAGTDEDDNHIIGVDAFNALADKIIEAANSYDQAHLDKEKLAEVVAKIKRPQFNIPRPTKEV